jgi:hypothetical protein
MMTKSHYILLLVLLWLGLKAESSFAHPFNRKWLPSPVTGAAPRLSSSCLVSPSFPSPKNSTIASHAVDENAAERFTSYLISLAALSSLVKIAFGTAPMLILAATGTLTPILLSAVKLEILGFKAERVAFYLFCYGTVSLMVKMTTLDAAGSLVPIFMCVIAYTTKLERFGYDVKNVKYTVTTTKIQFEEMASKLDKMEGAIKDLKTKMENQGSGNRDGNRGEYRNHKIN